MQAIPWEKAGKLWIISLKSLHQITKQITGWLFLKSVALHKTKQKLSIIFSYFKLKLSLVGFNKLIDKPSVCEWFLLFVMEKGYFQQ